LEGAHDAVDDALDEVAEIGYGAGRGLDDDANGKRCLSVAGGGGKMHRTTNEREPYLLELFRSYEASKIDPAPGRQFGCFDPVRETVVA
jgi:hypothetical protein